MLHEGWDFGAGIWETTPTLEVSHNDPSFLPTLNSRTAVGALTALLYSPGTSAARPTAGLGHMSVPSPVHLF